jgi:sirohydrochlorin ferrochelatase
VTDQSQPGEAQPGDPLPQRGGELPRRKPAGEAPPPQQGGSFWERTIPQSSSPDDLPQWRPPQDSPAQSEPLPKRGSDLPKRGSDLPQRGSDLPQRGSDLPQRGSDLPQRGSDLPQRGSDLPKRGEPTDGTGPLPRRTTRTRPSGRHRSPHRLSVASDAPALVLAVPGRADADSSEIGPRVASIAGLSCPGVDIRVGYLEGDELPVSECLLPAGSEPDEDRFPSVIVPLLLSPSAHIDAALRELAAEAAIPAVLASHLGPHPLVAEALHTRLADAGLARQARSTGLSISADGRGVVVLADVGEQAASAAGVAAVLLASRLSVPVVPASLGDPASIVDAVNRLTDSGAPRPALAPCLIGPETNVSVLDDLSAALGAPCAPTLGAHQAVGQLVAIRYGAALASLSLAG